MGWLSWRSVLELPQYIAIFPEKCYLHPAEPFEKRSWRPCFLQYICIFIYRRSFTYILQKLLAADCRFFRDCFYFTRFQKHWGLQFGNSYRLVWFTSITRRGVLRKHLSCRHRLPAQIWCFINKPWLTKSYSMKTRTLLISAYLRLMYRLCYQQAKKLFCPLER